MAECVYVLCVITSVLCAVLLIRGYRRSRAKLQLWSSVCFIGLAINNILLLVDLVVVPTVDLRIVRDVSGLGALLVLGCALVWERA